MFRALDDVSLRARRAANRSGIIGENGAGKSTLLKIVAGVITPTRGSMAVNGRVGALLELGSGFHPEYTGLANIDLAAALLGLCAREIAAKRDEIIAFADIGEHIHDPIKHYSSGMVVRLGFAVATALSPDMLITDEVLAVGDESFQKKCIAWMERYLDRRRHAAAVLAQHVPRAEALPHALWLKDGRPERYGAAPEVTQAYLAYHEEKRAALQRPPTEASASAAAGSTRLRDRSSSCPPNRPPRARRSACAATSYSPDGRAPVVLVGIVRADGTPVYGVATDMDGVLPRAIAADRFAFELDFPALPLLAGQVLRARACARSGGRAPVRHVEMPLVVTGSSREMGLVRIAHRWRVADRAPARSGTVATRAEAG